MWVLIASITSLALAIFLSVFGKNRRIKISAWIVFAFITSFNVIGYVQQQRSEKLYLNLLGPNISSKSAYQFLEESAKDLNHLELLEVLGSYYICLQKPDKIFHQFPEWVFVFRKQNKKTLVEYRVLDGRLPKIPQFNLKELEDLGGGHIAYHMKFKVSLCALGIRNIIKQSSDAVVIIDEAGRSKIEIWGSGPQDDVEELIDGPNAVAVARARVVGRPTGRTNEETIIDAPYRIGQVVIHRGELKSNDFYEALSPIVSWQIDEREAIERAMAAGALPIAAGKFGMSGGPGVFRMFNGRHRNQQGTFLQIPYRVKIRPVRINSISGAVFAVNDKGNYSTKW